MGTDIEYTKKIPLLALNTVAPKVTELFKKCLLALKPHDIGSKLIKKELAIENFFELPMCNPTATNCGLSYAVHMGFKEVYLIGTDYGMKSAKEHHSKNSIYHHIDEKIRKDKNYDKKDGKDYTYSDGQYSRAGNFGGEVLTINSLDLSRKNIEVLLNELDGINCYNPNDGALIQGAKPIKHNNIKIENTIKNKEKITEYLLSSNFKKERLYKIEKFKIKENYINNLIKYKEGLTIPKSCKDIKDLHSHLKRVFKNMKTLENVDGISAILLIGSIQIQFALLYISCLKCRDQATFQKAYEIGEKSYNKLITDIMELMEKEPFRLDDSVRKFN